jgi:hypothetical protein
VAENAPTPADAYGYWAFDDLDAAYAKHPPSATVGWLECDPRSGGSGTRVPIMDNADEADASVVVNLPFTFHYYGRSYDQISVCSNGWLAMGAGQVVHTDFRNYRIPSAVGPFAMIAPFWDDLRVSYTGTVQEAHDPAPSNDPVSPTLAKTDVLADMNRLPKLGIASQTEPPEPRGRGHLDAGSDYCTGIPVISALPYTDSGNTSTMANDWTTSTSCNIGGAPDVFYSYTPTTTATVRVSLCGSSYDTGLMIRSGGACPGSTEVTCDDDYSRCSPTNNSQVDVTMVAGTTYYIIVDGYGSASGTYALTVSVAPELCQNAAVIPALPYFSAGNTCGKPDLFGNAAPDTFYKYTVPAPGESLEVNLCGSDYDTYLRVWRTCGGTQLTYDDDACGDRSSKILTYFTAGDIWIHVEGFSSNCGNYYLTVSHYTPPRQCGTAATITSLPFVSSGNTCLGGNGYGNAAPDTFYKYTVPAAGETLSIGLCESTFDTYLRVWRPCGVTQLSSNDNSCGTASYLSNYFTAGDLWIQVEGAGNNCGEYTLHVEHVYPPRQCGTAATIPSLPFVSSGNTCLGGAGYGNAAPDTFYKFAVPSPGESLSVSLCESSFDTYLRLWRPCGTTQLSSDDNSCGIASKIIGYYSSGDLWIQVEGAGHNCGDYTLRVQRYYPPPPGGIFTYYDAANHRFAIEWSNARKYNGSSNMPVETFECILYEPGYPSTPTGDGEILFQYKDITNTSDITSSNDYCTAGIENPEKTDGVSYSYFNTWSPAIPGAAPLVSGRAVLFTTAAYSASTPRAPKNLTLAPIGGDLRLLWNRVREDVHGLPISGISYNIYAGTTADFSIDPAALIATVSDTFYVDNAPGDLTKFYAVQATISSAALRTEPNSVPAGVSKATYQKKGPIRQLRSDER